MKLPLGLKHSVRRMSSFACGTRGNMVKHLCAGLAVVAVLATAIAAEVADLSMTPIYKSRPSTASNLNGSLKDEYRLFDPRSSGFQQSVPRAATASNAQADAGHFGLLGTLSGGAVQTGADNRSDRRSERLLPAWA